VEGNIYISCKKLVLGVGILLVHFARSEVLTVLHLTVQDT